MCTFALMDTVSKGRISIFVGVNPYTSFTGKPRVVDE